MRILLVEDDLEIAGGLYRALTASGLKVDLARDGREGLEQALANDYAAIVLDLMLPRVDGLRVCQALRERRDATPILMITARNSVSDRVRGLEIGADDYLPKPFDVREFIARVRALVRRDRAIRARRLRVGPLELDTRTRSASTHDQSLMLTRLEYEVLEILAGNVGQTVTRESLLELVWQDPAPGSNKLDVAIRSLRRKLSGAGLEDAIRTVYGVGYSLHDLAADS